MPEPLGGGAQQEALTTIVYPIDEFFIEGLNADRVRYFNPAGVPKLILAIYQAPNSQITINDVMYESTKPSFIVKQADVEDAAHGCRLDRGTTSYYVVDIQMDGTGLTTLIVSLDPPHGT